VDQQLSQAALAARLKVPQSFVSKVETGERRLDILELRQFCRALEVPLNHFVQQLEDELG
jgi:transcriptional regulator with XRE-family HTH domain